MNKIKKYIDTKKIKLILISIIILVSSVIMINITKSNAFSSIDELINSRENGNVFGSINIGFDQLTSSPYLYCVQHHAPINSAVPYSVQYYVKITGKHAYCSDNDSENYNDDNARLAYILAAENLDRGYGPSESTHTERQEQLWGFWNRWNTYSGKDLGISWSWAENGDADYSLIKRANSYVENMTDAQISSDVGESIETDNQRAGAFRVTYTGTIASIVVKDIDNNDVVDGITFEQNGNTVQAKDIASGQDFYVINNSGKILKNITVNLNSGSPTYGVEMWLLSYGSNQKLIAVKPSVSPNKPASVTIGIVTTNTLRVVKYGINGSTNKKQDGVKFIVNKEGTGYLCSKSADTGKMTYNTNDFYWTQDKNSATIFKTSTTQDRWDGYFQITGLPSGKYYVGEVHNPNSGYENSKIRKCDLETYSGNNRLSSTMVGNIQENQNVNGYSNNLQVVSATLENGYTKILRIYDGNNDVFNLYIDKIKLGSSSTVSGAKFKIRVKGHGWLTKNGEKYNYDGTSYDRAKEWTTPNTYIYNLNPNYKYEIYETYSPYNLSKQPGHATVKIGNNSSVMVSQDDYAVVDDSKVKILYCGTVSNSKNGNRVTVTVSNYSSPSGGGSPSKKYLYIDGKIWIDELHGKPSQYNDLYDSNVEKLYTGDVKVALMNSSGKQVGSSTTTKNGSYSINTGISINSSTSKSSVANSLSGYYLKLEYDKKYITVSPNFDEENGSKALTKDDKEGEAYIYNLSDYVDKFYQYPKLNHMNMGLKKASEREYSLKEDIAYIKVVLGDYTYKYEYGGTSKDASTAAPKVTFENGTAYERAIYPSDIKYTQGNDSLKVYVIYRIDIKNTETQNYTMKKESTNNPVSYVEVDLRVTNLYNQYDTSRYEIDRDYDSNEFGGDFKNWADDGSGKVKYTGDKLKDGILPNRTKTVYVQFKVKKEALNNLLTKKETYENKPTTVSATAYHNYWKADYVWRSEGNKMVKKLEKIDKTIDTTHKPVSANYLKLYIGTERTITGTVFEDKNTSNNGEVLGNGVYNTDEGTVNNVSVELLTTSGQTAKLYNSTNEYKDEILAKVKTNNNGVYEFIGVTPGKYLVKFTYGDGTQKIRHLDGSEASVSLGEYKSTIVTDTAAMNALGYENGSKDESWYKNVVDIKHSVAVDNLEQRKEYNDSKNRTTIDANTAVMDISIENTKNTHATITKENNGTKEKVSGINLGIVKIPNISLALEKVINNVKITNAQGNIIADGNPATQNLKKVSNLDSNKNYIVSGSKYIKSEINEEELYGSTLDLSYAITVQNNSDINYYEKTDEKNKYYGYYYKFGKSNTNVSKEQTITINKVLDYLDPSIQYESIDNEHQVNVIGINESNKNLISDVQSNTGLTYTTIYEVSSKNQNPLYSTKGGTGKGNVGKTQDTSILKATRKLSAQDNDMSVSNVAKVTELKVTDDPALIEKISSSQEYFSTPNPTEEAYATVTPPTGKDKLMNVIYGVTSAIALVLLSAGIIVIKRKVIDKK